MPSFLFPIVLVYSLEGTVSVNWNKIKTAVDISEFWDALSRNEDEQHVQPCILPPPPPPGMEVYTLEYSEKAIFWLNPTFLKWR